jgi:hypothetical protein
MRSVLTLSLLVCVAAGAWANHPLTLSSGAGVNAGSVQRWNLLSVPAGAVPYYVNPAKPPNSNPTQPVGTSESDLVSVVRSAGMAGCSRFSNQI